MAGLAAAGTARAMGAIVRGFDTRFAVKWRDLGDLCCVSKVAVKVSSTDKQTCVIK